VEKRVRERRILLEVQFQQYLLAVLQIWVY